MIPDFINRTAKIIEEVLVRTSIDDVDTEVLEVLKEILQDALNEYYDEGYYKGYSEGYSEGNSDVIIACRLSSTHRVKFIP